MITKRDEKQRHDEKIILSKEQAKNIRDAITNLEKKKKIYNSLFELMRLNQNTDDAIEILVKNCKNTQIGLEKCLLELPETKQNITIITYTQEGGALSFYKNIYWLYNFFN